MSGMEVLGLVLGAFPLIISAMEHYEDVKKPTVIWWKIKRAHKKDLGKVKDCQLAFTHQLDLLLYPLLDDQVVDQQQLEQLLDPGGSGWRTSPVQEALADRLSTGHARYLQILEEMSEAMDKLCKATKVDDPQFQQLLEARGGKPVAKGQTILMIQANVSFQGKRLKYSLNGLRRDELLREVEDYIRRLRDILSANGELSALSRRPRQTQSRPVSKDVLEFWRHADNIFQLVRDAWHCNCRSSACLWLQRNYAKVTYMNMHLYFCHGGHSLLVGLSETPPTTRICGTQYNPLAGVHTSGNNTAQVTSANIGQHGITSMAPPAQCSSKSATMTMVAHSAAATVLSVVSGRATQNLQSQGLCKVFSTAPTHDVCVGTLVHNDDEYAVLPAVEKLPTMAHKTLADVLQPIPDLKLTRVQRYAVALTLASSHLQLHSSAWLQQIWTSESVHFPVTSDSNNLATLHGEPYVLADIGAPNNNIRPQKDRSFSTLGIVLLELCFGIRLEEHRLWKNPVYAAGRVDPIFRQTVACEWLDEVEDEAGEDYFLAVSWTLKQAPAVVRDNKWRADFAENVVQPLQRCYESMKPRK